MATKPSISLCELLSIASNHQQVVRCLKLAANDDILYDIPCISPLQASDLRRIGVSSYYGNRVHPIRNEYKHHSGIDLPGKHGEEVYAAANGIVQAVSYDNSTGHYIKIKHKYGFETLYGHLSKQMVYLGDTVKIGQVIGLVGNSGQSTGAHLHYGIKKNKQLQNPLPYCYLYIQWLAKRNMASQNVE